MIFMQPRIRQPISPVVMRVDKDTNANEGQVTEEQRHELQRINREWLESTPPPAGDAPP